jgi:AraC-like DNA-binding protein
MPEKMYHEEYRLRRKPFDPAQNVIQFHCAFRSCWKPGFTGKGSLGQHAIYALIKSGGTRTRHNDRTVISRGVAFSVSRSRNEVSPNSTSIGPEDYVRKCIMLHHNEIHEQIASAFIPEEKKRFPLTDPDKVEKILDEMYEELERSDPDDAFLAGLFVQLLQEVISQQQRDPTPESLQKARTFIRKELSNCDLSRSRIAEHCNLSIRTLCRLFERYEKIPVTQYIIRSRMEHARSLLSLGELSIKETAFRCGFRSAAFLTSVFRKHYGVTPREYRKQMTASR